jgi:F-type H+-transporting ATPase subunit c
MAKLLRLFVFVAIVGCCTPLMAQDAGGEGISGLGLLAQTTITGIAGVGAGLTLIGAGLGIGRIGASACESMARQPEIAAKIQTAMIISAALIEGAAFFALLLCFLVK